MPARVVILPVTARSPGTVKLDDHPARADASRPSVAGRRYVVNRDDMHRIADLQERGARAG